MTTTSRWTAVIAIAAAFLLSACDPKDKVKGDDGDRGPRGEAGQPGPQGPQGPKGDPGSADSWSRLGNGGTVAGTEFIGTTDNVSFEVRVNNLRTLLLEPRTTTGINDGANLIHGGSNTLYNGAVGCVVLGDAYLFGGGGPLENAAGSHYCFIGGGGENYAGSAPGNPPFDEVFATIGGGRNNRATARFAFVGGGMSNTAGGHWSSVLGGGLNSATGQLSLVCGGELHSVTGDHAAVVGGEGHIVGGTHAFVGGGTSNSASGSRSVVGGGQGNLASGDRSYIGGGEGHVASAARTFVGGGFGNSATGDNATVCAGNTNAADGILAFVGGGLSNSASGNHSAVVGGNTNEASGDWSIVGGGQGNEATGSYSTVGGGATNTASGLESVVAGGVTNTASSPLAAILGGGGNVARGEGSTIPGGIENETLALCTLAAGRRARTQFDGSFVWADVAATAGVDGDPFRTDSRANQFNAFASGGVRFVTRYDVHGAPVAAAELSPGSSSWLSQLDHAAVVDLRPADPREVLLRLRSLPLSTWSFAAQDPSVRHLGPLAPDFKAAFGLGESDRHIGHLDADGVALAAIQGLALELDARDARSASLEKAHAGHEERMLAIAAAKDVRIVELETASDASARRISELEARLERLERLLESSVAK